MHETLFETRELSLVCGAGRHFVGFHVRIFTVFAQSVELRFAVEASCCEPKILWAKEPLQHRLHLLHIVRIAFRQHDKQHFRDIAMILTPSAWATRHIELLGFGQKNFQAFPKAYRLDVGKAANEGDTSAPGRQGQSLCKRRLLHQLSKRIPNCWPCCPNCA